MKYDFQCESCNTLTEVKCSHRDFEAKKASGVSCRSCGATAQYVFNPSGVQISFTGDAWSDKNYKEKAYRKRRSAYMKQRQNLVHKRPELIPNYEGEEAGSWEEAADAARQAGKNDQSYQPLIQRERLQRNR
jgi:transcription elongation factor Elf1